MRARLYNSSLGAFYDGLGTPHAAIHATVYSAARGVVDADAAAAAALWPTLPTLRRYVALAVDAADARVAWLPLVCRTWQVRSDSARPLAAAGAPHPLHAIHSRPLARRCAAWQRRPLARADTACLRRCSVSASSRSSRLSAMFSLCKTGLRGVHACGAGRGSMLAGGNPKGR